MHNLEIILKQFLNILEGQSDKYEICLLTYSSVGKTIDQYLNFSYDKYKRKLWCSVKDLKDEFHMLMCEATQNDFLIHVEAVTQMTSEHRIGLVF